MKHDLWKRKPLKTTSPTISSSILEFDKYTSTFFRLKTISTSDWDIEFYFLCFSKKNLMSFEWNGNNFNILAKVFFFVKKTWKKKPKSQWKRQHGTFYPLAVRYSVQGERNWVYCQNNTKFDLCSFLTALTAKTTIYYAQLLPLIDAPNCRFVHRTSTDCN